MSCILIEMILLRDVNAVYWFFHLEWGLIHIVLLDDVEILLLFDWLLIVLERKGGLWTLKVDIWLWDFLWWLLFKGWRLLF
jgi:hypothetical protein